MQKIILYLSHGGQKYHDQTRYSVLTLLALLLEQNRNDSTSPFTPIDPIRFLLTIWSNPST